MVSIRQMRPEDLKDVEYICRMTAGPVCRREPIVGNKVAKMYSTYYVRECYDTCFVLADEKDKAVGYILCEPDFKRFRKQYRKIDVKTVKELDMKNGLLAFAMPIPYTLLGFKYPAHLHIDILDDYQGGGFGTRLMQTLLEELKNRGVKGVMLMASAENEGAIRFYKRFGFKMVFNKFGSAVMAKELK